MKDHQNDDPSMPEWMCPFGPKFPSGAVTPRPDTRLMSGLEQGKA